MSKEILTFGNIEIKKSPPHEDSYFFKGCRY